MRSLKQQTIRDYLSETGLLLEADESLGKRTTVKAYYGINVSKTDKEPIDQIQGPLALKRIQEWNLANFKEESSGIVFIGGLFEVLNTNSMDQLEEVAKINSKKEINKRNLYKEIADKFNLKIDILTTRDLWQDSVYWEIVYELIKSQVFTRGNLMNDTLNFYNSKEELMSVLRLKEIPKKYLNLPMEVLKKIGNWPAPLLYTPVQVAEGLYLKRKFGVNAKVGQLQERVYDKYLKGKLDTYRFRQSVDLLSTREKVQIVTPYIDKKKNKEQNRLYFGENSQDIVKKIQNVGLEEYIYTTDEKYCEVLNPIIEKTVYAIESARCQYKIPVAIQKIDLYSGVDLLNAIENGLLKISGIKTVLSKLISQYITNITKPL